MSKCLIEAAQQMLFPMKAIFFFIINSRTITKEKFLHYFFSNDDMLTGLERDPLKVNIGIESHNSTIITPEEKS